MLDYLFNCEMLTELLTGRERPGGHADSHARGIRSARVLDGTPFNDAVERAKTMSRWAS